MSKLSRKLKKAGKLYTKIMAVRDRLSCGGTLGLFINPFEPALRVKFDALWEEVEALDPYAPANPFFTEGDNGNQA